jgi:hypothetical protein
VADERQTFVRPDGRSYRPRKPGLRVRAWSNDGHSAEGDQGVIVFGTLDPVEAAPRAAQMCGYWFGAPGELVVPLVGWWRDGYSYAGRQWIEDEKRGAAGVMFTWEET